MAQDFGGLWLTRVTRQSLGPMALEIVRLHRAGLVPEGVPLYRTAEQARAALWWSRAHPKRTPPDDLTPVAFTPPQEP